ncbi:uridylate kinase [Methylomonas paludis]|uniref:Uridylate kinase n=1 Tax=Methylomonas paludis TaxID=1173101 RepID=A0A975R967_9GAMM|nr:uridylate kinase [Methylomonas paludis]QWF69963.1 uridylate kinase [Methylomonas paludis]
MRVVKLGGSLISSGGLETCLQRLAATPQATLLVPGGGEFAEQVRIVQLRYRFNDSSAHYMAILAMQQMAILYQALQPEFSIQTSLAELPAAGVHIWSPQAADLDKAGIAASWDVSSDSLAAWAATVIQADELILVKSVRPDLHAGLPDLQRYGIVDAAFAGFAASLNCPLRIIHHDDFI